MFERFTDRARRVVVLAQEEARLLDHNSIGSEHLLLGLIHEGEGVAAKALERCDVSLADVRTQVESIIGHGGVAPSGHIPFTPRAKTVLELSLREAMQLGHNYIGTEHILLALIREGDGVAAQVLAALGLELSHVRTVVVGLLQGDDPEPRTARGEFRTLEQSALVTTRSGGPRPAACSFCGVPSPGSGQLFTGTEGALICRQCAQGIVGQVGPRTMRVGPSTPGPFRVAPVPDLEALVASVAPTGSPPEDEDAARAEVERVFLAWGERSEDGVGLVNVEDGGGLGPYLDDIQQRYSAAQHSSLVVDAIVFVDATEAAVFTTTLYQGSPLAALQHKEGRAVLVDGSWLTTRQTIAERLAYIGVHVPPRAGELPPEIWRISSASFGVHAPTRSPGFVPPAGPRQFEPPFDALAARHEQTGPPPDDEVAARAAIEAAFRNLNERTADGRGLVNVEHGEDLGAAAARVEDRVNAMATRTVNVAEHVTFLDADHAVVWLTTVLLDGRPLLGPIRRRECRAVLVDGRWKVVYESVRELWALADVQIPPFGEPPAA